MAELDKGRPGAGAEPKPEAGSMPFFPGAGGPPGPPRPGPVPGALAAPAPPAPREPQDRKGVEGRITIDDDVIEKIAALAALEVGRVVALGGPEGSGDRGVRVVTGEDRVTLDLILTVEYGCVIMDVARAVQANVARVAGLMLGARVAAVNVSVADVRLPPADRSPAGRAG